MTKLGCLVFFLIMSGCWNSEAATGKNVSGMPNIIFLVADDLGYGELGCQGNPQIPTPHIDSIAAEGVRFTAGYVTAPNCSPSRAGFLTGRLGTRFGHEFNPTGAKNEDPSFGLPLNQRTLPEYLQDSGYITGLVGKWHLGGTPKYHPQRRGFDEFFGFLHEGHYFVPEPWENVSTWLRRVTLPGGGKGRRTFGKVTYSTHIKYNEPDYDTNNPILRGSSPIVEKEYFTDALTREATGFIERHQDKPFFLLVSYNAVHSPMQGADKYMDQYAHIEDIQRRIFAAMLANLDDSVGAITDKMEELGLNNTMICFFSDNGGPTLELTSSNLPLRGGKGQMYEGGIRVPFLLKWPGKIKKGLTYDRPVISTDLFATSLAAAGLDPPKELSADSTNLLPFLNGERGGDPHEILYWRQGPKTALRKGDMKIIRSKARPWELYDLSQDLSEEDNLSARNPALVKELAEDWKHINAQMIGAALK